MIHTNIRAMRAESQEIFSNITDIFLMPENTSLR
jgi:hypothetical protein